MLPSPRRVLALTAFGMLAAGCLQSSALDTCSDGTICAAPRVCAPAGGGCVDPAQVAACAGKADGDGCALVGIGDGLCRDAVCVVAGCGDGILDVGEACDDGNTIDDDACTNACARPSCGDGIAQGDEACDDGVANGDDRACTTRCLVAGCGDGLLLAGVEECDAGSDPVTGNSDASPCTSACTRNVCGDGKRWLSVEACDDGNTASGDGCRADCRKLEVCGDGAVDAGEPCDDGNANPADGCDGCVATAWQASVLLAGAEAATAVGLAEPSGVAVDARGDVFIADAANNRVRRIDAITGTVSTVAGTGAAGFGGDGRAATAANLDHPLDVAVDGLGDVFIADAYNSRVRRVDAQTGVITTVAGTSPYGSAGDGGPATAAHLYVPSGIDVDGLGNLYIADRGNHRVRRVDGATGVITTVAGTGVAAYGGDGGPATAARLSSPYGVALDAAGNLFIADAVNHVVRRVDAVTAIITTFAGDGGIGWFATGDGGPATAAQLSRPTGVAVDATGAVLIADVDNHTVRRVDATTGIITRVTGAGSSSYSGDGGPATAANVHDPYGVAADAVGNIYIGDSANQRVRRVTAATGVITTFAGTGGLGHSGDGGAATASELRVPNGVAVDHDGNVYIADTYNNRIRRVAASDGAVTTVAGTGGLTGGSQDDDVPATTASVVYPRSVATDSAGNLFLADSGSGHVRRVDRASGLIRSVVVGETLTLDGQDNLFVTDSNTNQIRRVDATTGAITIVAGTGTAGFAGDGGPATAAMLNDPTAVAVDGAGDVFISDALNNRVRRVDAGTGVITTLAGTGTVGVSGDGGPASAALLGFPVGVAATATGDVYITDMNSQRVRRVDATTGVITTVVGTGVAGRDGDGGPAAVAQLANPLAVAVDGQGDLFIADKDNEAIRRVDALTGVITTVAGQIDPEGMGPAAAAHLADPQAIVLAGPFTLFAGGSSGTVQALAADGATLATVTGRYPQDHATGALARYRDRAFGAVGGVAYDPTTDALYLTETTTSRLHRVTWTDRADVATWTIATVGDGGAGFADGALATARFRGPRGLLLDDASRTLYVADSGNHVVRAIALDAATVATVAGTPATLGYFGDGFAATDALLYAPTAVTLGPGGDLFIADTGNNRVRKLDPASGVITTVLGDGVAASSGEGAPATSFPVDAPAGLACDATGNLYVTSSTTVRLVPADAAGLVDGSGAVQTIYGAAPRDSFPALATGCLTGLAVVDGETVDVTDSCAGLLVELWRQPAP